MSSSKVKEETFDLLIIGGGINGAGIAVDAAGRGLKVALCDQADLGGATSSASTKLIHGGLRYLEHYEFGLVRKALLEREILLRKAPHLITPLRFVMPHNRLFRPRWMIRLGLFLYKQLSSRKSKLSKPTHLNLSTDFAGIPLKNNIKHGFAFSDCWVDDSRLVIVNAIEARKLGAHIMPYTQFITASPTTDRLWRVTLKHQQQTSTIKARMLINAAGPWVEQVLKKLDLSSQKQMHLVKGSHIVVPKLYDGDHAYLLQNKDKRIIFVIPYQKKFSLIGTTELSYDGDPKNVAISKEEKSYLCASINYYFKNSITPQDIIWHYSGVRPLLQDLEKQKHALSRDYYLELKSNKQHPPLLSVFGGKITTYRLLAKQVLDKITPFFPHMKPAWTANTTLPGGNLNNLSLENYFQNLCHDYSWLDPTILRRYLYSYGNLCHKFLSKAHNISDLGKHFGAGLYQREVEYLVQQEWVQSAEDLLWHRSKLGLFMTAAQVEKLEEWITSLRLQ